MTAPWFQTYTGRQYFYFDPRPEDICIEDIAHSLARQARFLGHTHGETYSVGQHSLLASAWIASVTKCAPEDRRKLELLALLHDSAECYLGDVPSPLKPLLKGYKELEAFSMRAIAKRFGLKLSDFADERVRHIDMVMLATEKRDLTGPEVAPWIPLPEPITLRITPEPSHIVEEMFLARFKQLSDLMEGT